MKAWRQRMEQEIFKFTPYLKTVLWGGNRICSYKGIPNQKYHIGESWEISALPGCESIVMGGNYDGASLAELMAVKGPELVGGETFDKYEGKFPLLVKIIDAADDLSLQVHPHDSLALERHQCPGKTEMWYIIESEKGSKIYSGLKDSMTPESFRNRLAEGNLLDAIAEHETKPGDAFMIPAGRIHSIGKGNMLFEIQQSSDVTYRIYDFDRLDASGKKRDLHTSLALDAIDFDVYQNYRLPYSEAVNTIADIVKCEYFNVSKISVRNKADVKFDDSTFVIIFCISGVAEVLAENERATISSGQTIIIRAGIKGISILGNAELLLCGN